MEVFVDTGFWSARLNPHDQLHSRASSVAATLGSARLVTSDLVLTELLNSFARAGEQLRGVAVALVRTLQAAADVDIVRLSPELFQAAVLLYADRQDKRWGLTDCTSFLIMRSRRIEQALTHDHHFEQAGFVALLQ